MPFPQPLFISQLISAGNVLLSGVIVVKAIKARHIDVSVYSGDVFK